jgi:uncharacterized protein YbjT (DUF2867 family)
MGLRVLMTGVTGMVGEGVLNECFLSPEVDEVLVVSRRPSGIEHLKFSEWILPDFFDLSAIGNTLEDFDACFFCLGVSSVGMKKEVYERMTYDLTIQFAKALAKDSPEVVFCYVSGAGTDSTEKGRIHWARVKGKTENDLQKLGLRKTFLFRPGILRPTRGLKNTLGFYNWAGWLLPIFEIILPNSICSLAQLGQAMIHAAERGFSKNILEVKDIKKLSE